MNNRPWQAIFDTYRLAHHDFAQAPFIITAEQIKRATRKFNTTSEREVRILCKQDTRESRPDVFRERGLFVLPVRNGAYAIVQGEGYVDIPPIDVATQVYPSQLDFELDTAKVGHSEMQHLDMAYAASLIRTFLDDPTLALTIRGRKYTPGFSFRVGAHTLTASSVQTEVDAGYEGRHQVVLIEAKAQSTPNVIIRQLYYPFRQWATYTRKAVKTLFFEHTQDTYGLWLFRFTTLEDYNAIELVKSQRFQITHRA